MSWITWSFHILKFVRWDSLDRRDTKLGYVRVALILIVPVRGAHMLQRVTSSSGCCYAGELRSVKPRNPPIISELRVSGMQWKHFKGSVQPIASRELAAVCLILWILAGSKLHPRKFLFTPLGCALPRAWLEYQRSIYLFLLVYYFICVFEFALFCTPLNLTL